jgi:integral membrane sensor domain MASE1
MLTEEEKAFMRYWELNRMRYKKITSQLLMGLPLGILFSMPILLNYFIGWFQRMMYVDKSLMMVVVLALMLTAVFIAIFSRRHKWEMWEQRYRELESREQATDHPKAD